MYVLDKCIEMCNTTHKHKKNQWKLNKLTAILKEKQKLKIKKPC